MDRDIFISYIEEDGAVARALASELRTLGQSPWTYEEDGVAGISYLTQVHGAIEACRAFVLLASHKSVNAHQVIREVEQAHEREKIIIPVRLGITHQQFTAANPILRMASGTAVTLAAEEGNVPAIAKRIAATLRFAEPQGRETPVGKQSVDSVTTTADAPSQAKAVGQNSSTEAEAALRPQYALASVIEKLPAVLTDYYGGPHQATGIADAIFGVTNPGGKLPFTMPRHVGQVPIHLGQKWGSGYRRTKEDIHKGYLDMPSTPLFAFGHGLSYTTFEYSPLKLASDTVDVGGEARMSLTITNTGKRRGTDVVQLYAADTATGVTLPAQQLIGFTRVDLERGASTTVSFVIPLSVLAYTGLSGEFLMEPGPIELSAGSSSDALRSKANLMVTGKTRVIKGEDRKFLSVATVGSSGTSSSRQ